MSDARRRYFTLPEVVAVIVILGMLAAIAVPMLRDASPAERLRQSALEFGAFCARVRLQAVEQGADRAVCYDPASKTFRCSVPDQTDEDDPLSSPDVSEIRWKLPADLSFNEDSEPEEDAEIFRFFPDGSASGQRTLTFRCGKVRHVFEVSLLTGLLNSRETDGEDEDL